MSSSNQWTRRSPHHICTIYPCRCCSRFPASPCGRHRVGLPAAAPGSMRHMHVRTRREHEQAGRQGKQGSRAVEARLLLCYVARTMRLETPRWRGAPALAAPPPQARGLPATSEPAPTAGARWARRVLHVRNYILPQFHARHESLPV